MQFTPVGRSVKFGQAIQLLHEATQSFLAIRSTDAKSEVYLEQDQSVAETWFFVKPKFKLQSVGERVYFNEEIRFVNIRTRKQLDVEAGNVAANRLNTGWKISNIFHC